MDTITPALTALSSDALTARLGELLGTERRCVVDFLRHLAELDRRHGYLDLGFPSLFAYCAEGLRLSNASAYRRTHAARLLARFPAIADYLTDGRLCLTTVVLLKDVLQPENHLQLLDSAASRTEDEVKLLVAELQPRPDIQDSIRRVPVRPMLLVTSAPPAPGAAPVLREAIATQSPPLEPVSVPAARSIELVPPPPPPRVEPLDAERYSLKMSVGKEFLDELDQVKAALSHTVPGGKLEDVLLECFRLTLEACARRRRGSPSPRCHGPTSGPEVTAPLTSPAEDSDSTSGPEVTVAFATHSTSGPEVTAGTAPDSTSGPEVAMELETRDEGEAAGRYLPVEVRRDVWLRDAGSCTFVGVNGRRCGSTHQLEFHHRVPFAVGGPSSTDNLTLHCRPHNRHRARADFGDTVIARYTRQP